MSQVEAARETTLQNQWRWCRKCQGLFFAGGSSAGVCPAGAPGERHEQTGSGDYRLAFCAPELSAADDAGLPGQSGWRWCGKCQGLHFTGGDVLGACAAGGAHDPAGSANYALETATTDGSTQQGWRRCGKCQGLYYALDASAGVCPAQQQPGTQRSAHEPAGAEDYALAVVEIPRPKPPHLLAKAWNLATSVAAFVADGFQTVTREQYEQRLEICDSCDQRRDTRCLKCGCHLALKARARAFACPLQKWPVLK